VPLLLVGVAALAVHLPARRAAAVDLCGRSSPTEVGPVGRKPAGPFARQIEMEVVRGPWGGCP
jgi:hypothetical protein